MSRPALQQRAAGVFAFVSRSTLRIHSTEQFATTLVSGDDPATNSVGLLAGHTEVFEGFSRFI
jgi:hypothetical protein